jgi:hypothetical protein
MVYDDKGLPGRKREAGAATNNDTGIPPNITTHITTTTNATPWRLTSHQVDWYSVYQYVNRILEGLGIQVFPAAGTPAWCQLGDSDPLKLAAALAYAPHHALRVETAQQASAVASHAVSAAMDWAAVGRRIQDQDEFYAAHPWLRRRVIP